VERKPATRQHDYRRQREHTTTRRDNISLGQLAVSVAYHYHLTPKEIACFSGQQLLLWHERAGIERGYEKLLELDVSLVPHTEEPDKTCRELREHLIKMTEQGKNGR
jgi:hypothetical protein